MAYILNIETATKNCSVALQQDDCFVDLIEYAGESYSHAEKLHVFIQEILQKNNLSPKRLDAVSVSKGPGSYTGLRIGVSAAKSLAYALDIPLISVSTLDSLARNIKVDTDAYIIPVIDARRMEVYSAVYDTAYNRIRNVQADLLDENPFGKYLDEKTVYFVGDAIEKTRQSITSEKAVFSEVRYPSAVNMIAISYMKFNKKSFEDTAYFEPYYLKDFIISKKKNI
jgi:tRNA threonylcarbamoyladenosine biosynthesis protein TsaB